MNGVHDMGGMHGLGMVAPDPAEPLFHAEWESRVLAMTLAMGAWGRWNIDVSRHARESIPGERYLPMTYYERWFTALTELTARSGLASAEEIARGAADETPAVAPPLTAARVLPAMLHVSPYARAETTLPVFAVGDVVRAKLINPTGHTRLPRYARGRTGTIVRHHGVHVFPDANAHGAGERPSHLYGVKFTARELWGEAAAPDDAVFIDLWEPYLDPA